MIDLGTFPGAEDTNSFAAGVSANGRVIVGQATLYEPPPINQFQLRAARWVSGAIQDLGTFGGSDSSATGVSADGSVVVGWAHDAAGERRAFRWNGAPEDLGTFGGVAGEASAVSADGNVVIGRALDATGQFRPFRWSAAGGLEDLGTFSTFQPNRIHPNYASADGRVIVGHAGRPPSKAWIWTEEEGMRDLNPLIEAAVPPGGVMREAMFVSADGRTVAGLGRVGGGPDEAWVVRLCSDDDEDGLCNEWETDGIDVDGDGNVDLDLPALGADPDRKDLFIEIDAMTGLAPDVIAIENVVVAFDGAPVTNPDGSTGIILHYELDETNLPVADWPNKFADFDVVKQAHFGTPAQRGDPNWENIRRAKRRVYRYCVFGRSHSGGASVGFGEVPGDDLAVTLGHPRNQAKLASPFYSARVHDLVAGTFMHELGHTQRLHHGGGDGINDKPNYHSVMNYTWQIPYNDYADSWLLDYSRDAFPTLDESHLDETAGIGGHPGHRLQVGLLAGTDVVDENGPVDWDGNGAPDKMDVAADINFVYASSGPSPGQVLTGHDDWENIKLAERGPNWFDGVHVTYGLGAGAEVEEITPEIIEELARNAGPGGDCDGNGFVELDDYGTFAPCMSGPLLAVSPECDCADMDRDGDADLSDFRDLSLTFDDPVR